ncbi:MAG: hypothetical protein OEY01_03590 [Desulfobulbaceae bacterium]|nr:hypothetical protein [Desulfobulbaceae bacterium]
MTPEEIEQHTFEEVWDAYLTLVKERLEDRFTYHTGTASSRVSQLRSFKKRTMVVFHGQSIQAQEYIVQGFHSGSIASRIRNSEALWFYFAEANYHRGIYSPAEDWGPQSNYVRMTKDKKLFMPFSFGMGKASQKKLLITSLAAPTADLSKTLEQLRGIFYQLDQVLDNSWDPLVKDYLGQYVKGRFSDLYWKRVIEKKELDKLEKANDDNQQNDS